MAKKPIKASKKNLVCKIVNIEADPLHQNRMLVSVEIDDGDPAGPWIQGFSLLPEKKLTLSDFMDMLYQKKLERPVDPYEALHEIHKTGEQFVLNLSAKIEPEPDA